jgi:hypothetical protein
VKNGTTRHYTPFRGDTDRKDFNLALPSNLNAQQRLKFSNHAPNEAQTTRIKLGLPIMQEELPVFT